MPTKPSNRASAGGSGRKIEPARTSVSAESALSFLKDSKAVVSWEVGEMARVLKIGRQQAEQAVALLEAQGYVARAEKGSWMTTAAGEFVSGAKAPRFSLASVEEALASLKARIKDANRENSSPFQITRAVAFGDFLLPGRMKVQAADVGLELEPRGEKGQMRSATEAKAENHFLKGLRGKAQMLNVRPYAQWMGQRSHRALL